MSTASDIRNTRKHQRDPMAHEIQVMLKRDLPGGLVRTFSGRIVDKTAIGFSVETSSYVSRGELLRVCTDISGESEMYLDVRWVYNHESGYLFGCKLVDLSMPEAVN